MKGEWCEQHEYSYVGPVKGYHKAPKFIRCKKCNRRLKPLIFDCEDMFRDAGSITLAQIEERQISRCIHIHVPRHKSKK